jgi:hypothetical protein
VSERPTRGGDDRDVRWPVIVLVVVVLVLAFAVDRVVGDDENRLGALTFVSSIPRADEESGAWFCAAGSSVPDGGMDESVYISNLGAAPARAELSVLPGAGQPATTVPVELPPREQTRVKVSDVLATPEPGVLVETFGGPTVVEHEIVGHDDLAVGPCATRPAADWHFAAGTTERGTELWAALFNPFGDEAVVDLTFLTDTGFEAPGDLQAVPVPSRSRVMVPVHESVRRQAAVATQVRARTGRVVAELVQRREEAPRGLALSLGSPVLAPRWSVASGGVGGASTVVLANPEDSPARVTVRVRLDGDATLAPQTVVVPSRAVVPVDVGARVPEGLGSWVQVDAHGSRIVAEHALAREETGLAHALGIPVGVTRWAVAEARAGRDADDVVVAANAGDRAARVALRLVSNGDERTVATELVAPGRRAAFELGALDLPRDATVVLTATLPVAVARASAGPAGVTTTPAIPGAGTGAR